MEITKTINDKVEIQYTVQDGEWTYMDTLLVDPKEAEGIDKVIEDKYTAWKEYVTTPIVEPTDEEKQLKLQAERDALEAQLLQLDEQLAVVTARIDTKIAPIEEPIEEII